MVVVGGEGLINQSINYSIRDEKVREKEREEKEIKEGGILSPRWLFFYFCGGHW